MRMLEHPQKTEISGVIIMLWLIWICITFALSGSLGCSGTKHSEKKTVTSNNPTTNQEPSKNPSHYSIANFSIPLPVLNEVVLVKTQEDPTSLLKTAMANHEFTEEDTPYLKEEFLIDRTYVRLQGGETLHAGTKVELSYPSRNSFLEDLDNNPIEATLAEDVSVEASKKLDAQVIQLKFFSDQGIETQVAVVATYPNADDIKRMKAYLPELSNGFEDDRERMESILNYGDTAKVSGFIVTKNSEGRFTKHPVAGNLYQDQMELHSVISSPMYSKLASPLMEMVKNYSQEYNNEKAASTDGSVSKDFLNDLAERLRPTYINTAIPLIALSSGLSQFIQTPDLNISGRVAGDDRTFSINASLHQSLGSEIDEWIQSARVLLWSNPGRLEEDNQQITAVALQPVYSNNQADSELATIMLRYNPSFAANDFACEIATIGVIFLRGTYLGNEEAFFSILTTPPDDLWTLQYAHLVTSTEKESSFISFDFKANDFERPREQKRFIRSLAGSITKMTHFRVVDVIEAFNF